MKNLFLSLLIILLVSCNEKEVINTQNSDITSENIDSVSQDATRIEYLGGYLRTDTNITDAGFYRIKLSDGKEVLVYKDGNGVSMIKL